MDVDWTAASRDNLDQAYGSWVECGHWECAAFMMMWCHDLLAGSIELAIRAMYDDGRSSETAPLYWRVHRIRCVQQWWRQLWISCPLDRCEHLSMPTTIEPDSDLGQTVTQVVSEIQSTKLRHRGRQGMN